MSMTDAEIREALARAEREIVGLKAALACCPASTPPCELDTRWQDLVRLWTEERYARCAAERERYAATEAWKPSVDEWRAMSVRAETAEARCRELEAERAIVADYLRDTDADFRARRPSERAVLDALLSPPPPHTCQIHRATSGASDCGLSPCEEATVHRDRGAARPATVRRVRPAPSQEATETWRDAIGCAPSPPGSISSEEAVRRVRDGETTPFEADTMTHEDGGVA